MPCIPDFIDNAAENELYSYISEHFYKTDRMYVKMIKNRNDRPVGMAVKLQVFCIFEFTQLLFSNTNQPQAADAKLNEYMLMQYPQIAFLCGRGW